MRAGRTVQFSACLLKNRHIRVVVFKSFFTSPTGQSQEKRPSRPVVYHKVFVHFFVLLLTRRPDTSEPTKISNTGNFTRFNNQYFKNGRKSGGYISLSWPYFIFQPYFLERNMYITLFLCTLPYFFHN